VGITVVTPGPQLFLDRLTATVVLRQIIALAEQAPLLSDDQLRNRLASLARMARSAVTDSRCTDEAPAGHRLRDTPESPPGGPPIPSPAAAATGTGR
jgi:hypothetical protein